jgi:hypothetical protein
MAHQLQQAITTVSNAAFLHGLHTSMFLGAALAFAGALLGLLVQRGSDIDLADAAVA